MNQILNEMLDFTSLDRNPVSKEHENLLLHAEKAAQRAASRVADEFKEARAIYAPWVKGFSIVYEAIHHRKPNDMTLNSYVAACEAYTKFLTSQELMTVQAIPLVLRNKITEELHRNNLGPNSRLVTEATRSTALGQFADYGYKMIAAIMANLAAEEMAAFQPMKLRTSDIVFLQFRAGSNRGRVRNQDFLYSATTGPTKESVLYTSNTIPQELVGTGNGTTTLFSYTLEQLPVLTGNIKVEVFNGTTGALLFQIDVVETPSGNNTATLTGSARDIDGAPVSNSLVNTSTINYVTGALTLVFQNPPPNGARVTITYDIDFEANTPQTIGEVEAFLTQIKMTAKPYKVRGLVSLDASFDFSQTFGINIRNVLDSFMTNLIKSNIDNNAFDQMYRFAAGGLVQFDATVPAGISQKAHFESLNFTLSTAASLIFRNTKTVGGNVIAVGKHGYDLITSLDKFIPEQTVQQLSGDLSGPYVAGTLGGKYKIIHNPFYPDNVGLMGSKNSNYLLSGFIIGQYRPLFASPEVVLADDVAQSGQYTSVGMRMVNDQMFVRLRFNNL
jgi:hypothetical protein